MCQTLADEHVNILALTLEAGGTLRLVVDNALHAANTLRERHYQVQEADVLYTQVPNQPGALARVARLMAEGGINVEYAYATGLDTAAMVALVMGVADAERASAATGI